MAEIVVSQGEAIKLTAGTRSATVRRFALSDALFHRLTEGAALIVLILGEIILR